VANKTGVETNDYDLPVTPLY